MDIKKDVLRILKENQCEYDFNVTKDGVVEITIEWGDWKHDHIFVNVIMEENGYEWVMERVTEEDNSDTYSSIHFFKYGA